MMTMIPKRAMADFKIKYPKLLLLFLTFALAYVFLSEKNLDWLRTILVSSGYIGTFISGMLFAYGFTAGPATASFLILSKSQNILLAGITGGFGAFVSDYFIFRFVRHSFADEIELISEEKITRILGKTIPKALEKYLAPLLAGFIIASPLPDEIGVTLLAASRDISMKQFAVISFSLNSIGIFAILFFGNWI